MKIDIRERLKLETKGYSTYYVRREEYKSGNDDLINFRVSPEPFKLNKKQMQEIEEIGKAICSYMDCCMELYEKDENVHELLDRGKPNEFRDVKDAKYLFLRPDLILTESGFSICEIETSPFGLGLAEILNRAYGNEGFNPIVPQNKLKNYINSKIGDSGTIVYSKKVEAFSGQLRFLADEVFSGNGKIWNAAQITPEEIKSKEIYRAFYLNEYTDKNVANLLGTPHIYLPTSTPQFEEKALLSFIWDKRYIPFLKANLGDSAFDLLRKVIPKTWVLGEEKYVDGGLPNGMQDSLGLATLGKGSRKYVLKQSGFSKSSSWGEGVKFLHKIGGNRAAEIIKSALDDKEHLYIIQEFHQCKDVQMSFIDDEGEFQMLDVRVRITPYYGFSKGNDKGKIIAFKVTGCEKDAKIVHAGTKSINTAGLLEI